MVRLKKFFKGAMEGMLVAGFGLLGVVMLFKLIEFIKLFSDKQQIPGWLVFGFVTTIGYAIIFGLIGMFK